MTSDLTTRAPSSGSADPGRPDLVTRALLLRFVSVVGTSIGFYLPLSVVPLLALESGSAGTAGLATVALLLTTVVCELVTPRLVTLVGYRWALGLGLTLLGAPTVVLAYADSTWLIVVVSIVRGAGFGISIVAGGAVTALLIPAARRGEGLALVGIVSGVPGLIALPAGVWAASRWGYDPVFVVTTAVTLLALLSVPSLPGRGESVAVSEHHGVLAGLRCSALSRPATIFAVSTAAVGVLVTFLPLAISGQRAWVAAAALLAQPAASTVGRFVAGRIGDQVGPARLLVPGLLLCVVGMAGLAATGSAYAVIGGAFVFGSGFGVLQNATLVLMYVRVPVGGESSVSAIWNAAYDLGMAGGALCAGPVVTVIGYQATFVVTAAVMLPALAVVRRDRVRSRLA